VAATGSRLLELNGIGPSGAARLIGDIADIARFADRGHFASWNGTAPLDASSGEQTRHRLSRAGNRRINRTLHIMAVVQLRHDTEGRGYYRRKLAAGKTHMEAMRALKRRLSDLVYRQMAADATAAGTGPGGQSGATLQSSAAGPIPIAGASEKSLPGPATTQRRTPFSPALDIEGSQKSNRRAVANPLRFGRALTVRACSAESALWVPINHPCRSACVRLVDEGCSVGRELNAFNSLSPYI
jgi:hypothetical protein